MQIVATADLHGHLIPRDEIPGCDVLIIAGDVCPNWDHSVPYQRSWLELEFSRWLNSLREANGGPIRGPILGIGGNHDFALERSGDFARTLPWKYLLDARFEYRGVVFHGIPWVPNLSKWAFHHMDHEIDDKYALIDNDVDVVISHGPPWGLCDRTVPKFGNCHAGFPGANDMLERVQPEVLVCGHIHEGYGHRHTDFGGYVFNVARNTETYKPVNRPVRFTLGPTGALQGFSGHFPENRRSRQPYPTD